MSSRKKKSTEEDNNEADQLPAESNDDLTVSSSVENEASGSDSDQMDSVDETSTPGPESEDASSDESMDDILDDVRRSLIENESKAEAEKQPKWWQKIGKGFSKEEPRLPVEETKPVESIFEPTVEEAALDEELDELKEELESEEYLEQIDELIDLLDDEPVVAEAPVQPVVMIPEEPAKPVDLEELKKQAFQPRANENINETVSEVRTIALEGDEEVFVEVESSPQDPFEERVKAFENALQPYRRYVNFAVAFLGVVIALIAMLIIYNVYQESRPQPVVEQATPSLPYPIAVSLPGGWQFNLGRGTLRDGRWEPKGAEWLEGTEVCRWVSLPWSRQLEAVLRTLNAGDPVELAMSNSDKLPYEVYSIQQMSPEEMQQLDSNTPCLLIMLADENAEKRWVLTALP